MKLRNLFTSLTNKSIDQKVYNQSGAGLYVSIIYTPYDQMRLMSAIYSEEIKDHLVHVSDLHTTIIHAESLDEMFHINPRLSKFVIELKNKRYSLFGPNNDVLVIEFDSEVLATRRNEIINEIPNLTETWTEYRPHITIAKNFNESLLKHLPPIETLPDVMRVEREEFNELR